MGLFSKNKKDHVPETAPVIAHTGHPKIRLNKTLSKETVTAISSKTLQAGGWVEDPPAEPKIGDTMPDGTIYAGVSPDTGKPMYATCADAPLTMTFNKAQKYAAKLDAHGHQDWRVPTKAELNVLFNNRAAIGSFDISGSYPSGYYWSASSYGNWDAWGQRFSNGYQNYGDKNYRVSRSSVRCVR